MESEETEGAVRRSTSGPFGKDKKQRGSAPGYVLPPISHSLGCSHLPGFILVSDPRCRDPCGAHQQYNSKVVGIDGHLHLNRHTFLIRLFSAETAGSPESSVLQRTV